MRCHGGQSPRDRSMIRLKRVHGEPAGRWFCASVRRATPAPESFTELVGDVLDLLVDERTGAWGCATPTRATGAG